jgi:class 3 adenylate cyclase
MRLIKKKILVVLSFLIFPGVLLFSQDTAKITLLKQQITEAKTDSVRIQLYLAIGDELTQAKQPYLAIDFYKKALQISEQNTYFVKYQLSQANLANEKSSVFRQYYIIAVAVILIVLLTYIIYRSYKHTKKTRKFLNQQNEVIASEKEKSDKLLLNILPKDIAEELKESGFSIVKHYDLVSVLFADFAGFSKIVEEISFELLVAELDMYFKKFDKTVEKHHLEKIKTIGDAYMCAGGLPLTNPNNPILTVLAGLHIQRIIESKNVYKILNNISLWELRVGIHTGPVIAGVVGEKKFAYDIWGDTVNIASRMEAAGDVGKVNISGTTYEHIKDYFDCTYRGKIPVKSKGEIDMYYVEKIKDKYSVGGEGILPSDEFLRFLEIL